MTFTPVSTSGQTLHFTLHTLHSIGGALRKASLTVHSVQYIQSVCGL